MNWTLKVRQDLVRKKLRARRDSRTMGANPKTGRSLVAEGGWQGKIGKVSQGALWKVPNPRLGS